MANRLYPSQNFYIDRRPRTAVITIFITRITLNNLNNAKTNLIFLMDEDGLCACQCSPRSAAELLYVHGETITPQPLLYPVLQLPKRPLRLTAVSFTLTLSQLNKIEADRFVILISAHPNGSLQCYFGQPDDIRMYAFPRYRPPASE